MSLWSPTHTLIYTDGACSGNPGPGGWGAVILTTDHQITEMSGGENRTTNNRMEILAAIAALEFVARDKAPILLYTDSTYLIHGITKWVYGWEKRGWQNANGDEIANPDLWQQLLSLKRRRSPGSAIEWRYVRGHQGHAGNERCDELAVAHSQGQSPHLYRGSVEEYAWDITNLPPAEPLPDPKFSTGPKPKAFSYLSYVGGVLERHATWAECERVVKGRPGAKFKKAQTPEEESLILKSWGLAPNSLNKKS